MGHSRLRGFADAAAKKKLAFHLVLHPSLSTEEMDGILVQFLAYCAEQRERGVLDVFTARGLVEEMQKRIARVSK